MAKLKVGIVGPSYVERSLPFDAQETINLYVVMDDQGGKSVAALYGTPGLKLFASIGVGPIRQEFPAANGRSFVVSGSVLYEVDVAGNQTARGSLNQSAGIVYMEENPFQLAICDGATLYIFTYATNAFTQVTAPGFLGASTLTFLDSYFIVSVPGAKGQFQISAPNDGLTWNALDFATAESSPDPLARVIAALGQLFLQGTLTTEIWTNTGSNTFPFAKIAGGKTDTGSAAPATAVVANNSLIWVARDKNNRVSGVFQATGIAPKRVSNSPIERILQAVTDPTQLVAFTYQRDGHLFYVITGGDLPMSLCLDLTTGYWHKRAYLNDQGEFEIHRANCGMVSFGKYLVGDRDNGNVYELDEETYDDNGQDLVACRVYTHIANESQRIRYNKLTIDCETGVGLEDGSDPQIALRMSKDGARTWGNWYTTSMGKVGNYKTQCNFRRLGITEVMTFEVRISDPVKRTLIGSYLS